MRIDINFSKFDDQIKWMQANPAAETSLTRTSREVLCESKLQNLRQGHQETLELQNSNFVSICIASIVEKCPKPSSSKKETVLGLQGISQSDVEL